MEIRSILVTGRLREALRALEKRFPGIRFDFQDEGQPVVAEYDGYIGFVLAPGLKEQALKWVHSLGAGVDGLLSTRQFSPDTIMTRTVGDMPRRIGRYCRMCILMEDYRLPDILPITKGECGGSRVARTRQGDPDFGPAPLVGKLPGS